MSVVTSQQIRNYYDNFKSTVVTFTRDVNQTLGLVTNQIYLKLKDHQRPCVIYSASMEAARIIVSLDPACIQAIKENQNLATIRFAFRTADKAEPINFFVQCRLTGLNLYNKDRELYFANLNYTQRPPDDLIELLGRLLEATSAAEKRREDRIILTADNMRKLGLISKNAKAVVQKIPRNVIIRDLSFNGAKVIILGNAKFLVDKEIEIQLLLVGGKSYNLIGKIVRFETVEGRKDIAALAVHYDEEKIPLDYKIMLNNYLQSNH
jgi:hypothetical protein